MPTPIPDRFRGAARAMSAGAICATAARLDCEETAIRAVIAVESRGGFDSSGRPVILFERHYFHRLTNGRFDSLARGVSHSRPGGYGPTNSQYRRLADAMELDRAAALRSASWGAFQIMGDNCDICGFPSIEEFVAAMCEGEDAHLAAFAAFVESSELAIALRRHDWAAFARGYNGPAYRRNRYDEKLATAYAREGVPPVRTLAMGARGDAVRALQRRLAARVDGVFGPVTRAAVCAFQKAHALSADGIAGPKTWNALRG
ncbi:N-acetylmuramidase domain-containing protein [Erythrobacter sp. LQ02-29]|uniref:N-acetylmuramidase domain-containing protein n=1 Tax=Erythrobacter sp. LQ02-29 TaxID=2920384 RepID=UPI001F4E571A|nr:N-acetylmuramidase domain-containing protein [Erythrobacter sp. LQ02-29]